MQGAKDKKQNSGLLHDEGEAKQQATAESLPGLVGLDGVQQQQDAGDCGQHYEVAGVASQAQSGWVCRKQRVTGASHSSSEEAEQSRREEEDKQRSRRVDEYQTDVNRGRSLAQDCQNHGRWVSA